MNTNPFIDPNVTSLGGPRVCEPCPVMEFGGSSCPIVIEPPRPDVEKFARGRLRLFLAELIQQQKYWQARADGQGNWKDALKDSTELRALCGQAAVALGPVIGAVTVAAAEHERRLTDMGEIS